VNQRLVDLISNLRDRIDTASAQRPSLSEQDTKLAIINPLLGALGWDLSSLAQVRSEYRHRPSDDPVDYAMFLNGAPALFVEAKRLAADLSNRKFITQVVSYAATVGVDWCVLTDGNEYRFYNAHAPVDAEDKLFLVVRLDEGDPLELANTLGLLSPDGILNNKASELWQAQYVDDRLKDVLERLVAKQDASLVRLLAKHIEGASRGMVASSLGRMSLTLQSSALLPKLTQLTRTPVGRKVTAPRASGDGHEVQLRSPNSPVGLSDLIAAGILAPPLKLFALYLDKNLTAVVTPDGKINFNGTIYASPSAAAGYAQNEVKGPPPDGRPHWPTNGWKFWCYDDPELGESRLLDTLRQRLLKPQG